MFSLKLFGVKFDDAGRPPNRYEANLDPLIQRARNPAQHCQRVACVGRAVKDVHPSLVGFGVFAMSGLLINVLRGIRLKRSPPNFRSGKISVNN